MIRRIAKGVAMAALVYVTAAHAATEHFGQPTWPWRHLAHGDHHG